MHSKLVQLLGILFFVVTLLPQDNSVMDNGVCSLCSLFQETLHSHFRLSLTSYQFTVLGSCTLKKKLSASLFTAFVSYSTNQIPDLMDRYTALPYVSCTYRCHHAKQCCIHLLPGLNYLEQRDCFKPNKLFRNTIQRQAEMYRSM